MSSRVLKKWLSCFDRLSMNGKSLMFSLFPPFGLSWSKGERRGFQYPVGQHSAVNAQYPGWGRVPCGLALIELVVALGIAGMFYTALYGFYRLHAGVLKAEEVRINVQETSRLALDFLVRELHLAGARPVRGGPCDGFERLTVAEEQTVTMQYDFRGDSASAPPDGCPDDPSELITYTYDSAGQGIKRATSGGAPQPFISDVPADGFLLRYFDRDGN